MWTLRDASRACELFFTMMMIIVQSFFFFDLSRFRPYASWVVAVVGGWWLERKQRVPKDVFKTMLGCMRFCHKKTAVHSTLTTMDIGEPHASEKMHHASFHFGHYERCKRPASTRFGKSGDPSRNGECGPRTEATMRARAVDERPA